MIFDVVELLQLEICSSWISKLQSDCSYDFGTDQASLPLPATAVEVDVLGSILQWWDCKGGCIGADIDDNAMGGFHTIVMDVDPVLRMFYACLLRT